MLRPSDIAPNCVLFNSVTGKDAKSTFTVQQLDFKEGGVEVTLFCIKNDMQRKGFQVMLPRSSVEKLDPVLTLQDYICRTDGVRPQGGPVFLTLRPPFKALEASSIAKVLDETIKLAGLADQGFTAMSFRPTGATAAIDQQIDP